MPTPLPPATATPSPIDQHVYNDDLLSTSKYRDLAAREFPRVIHVLDQPEMRAAFEAQDVIANRAKRRSQAAGFWALMCGLFALMIASGELALEKFLSPGMHHLLAAAGLLLTLGAVLVAGFGLVRGKQKVDWLHRRLFTERLRQFHFQTFVWRLPEIVASIANPDKYRREWTRWFDAFKYTYGEDKSSEIFPTIIESTGVPPIWLHEPQGHHRPAVPHASPELAELFRAYKELRLKVQHGYATHMLRSANAPSSSGSGPGLKRRLAFPFIGWPLRQQHALLRGVWLVTFAGLVLLHILAFVVSLADVHSPAIPWLLLGLTWSALLAIAAKTLTEGLGLSREIERYEEYRAILADLLARFDPSGDPQECVEQMMEFERATFEEMRAFLRVHSESSFVI